MHRAVCCICILFSCRTPILLAQDSATARAVAQIRKLGGAVELDEGKQPLSVEGRFSGLTDAGLVHVSGMTGLQKLDLTFTKITDAGLVHLDKLTELRWLNLVGTAVTDKGLPRLAMFQKLTWFNAGPDSVSKQGMMDLVKKLPHFNFDPDR